MRGGSIRLPAAVAPAALVFAALALATALTKKPWFDEVHFTGPAVDLITRGSMGQPLFEPLGFASSPGTPQLRVNTRAYYAMPLSHLAPAVWYKLVGFGLFRMRALAMLWGLAALSAWCFIVFKLTESRAMAGLSGWLIATDRFFVDSGADGRPDMMSAALGALALAAYLALRERSLGRAVLVSQALLAAAVFTHPIGGIAGFAIALVAIAFDLRRLDWRHFLLAAIPYAVGGALWALYISVDPEAFRAQIAGNSIGRFKGFSAPLTSLVDEIRIRFLDRAYAPSYATGLRRVTVLIPAIYAAAVIAVLFSRAGKEMERQPAGAAMPGRLTGPNPGARLLATLAVVYFFAFGILEGTKPAFYLVHFTPLLACCTACWTVAEWQRGGWRRRVAAGMAALLILLQVSWIAYGIRRDSYRHAYLPAVAYLNQHAGPNDLIFAVSELAFGLGFYGNLRDDSTLGYFTGKRAAFIVVEEPGYGEAFRGFAALNPALGRYVQKTLKDDYQKVYANSVYEIYARR
jgi:hypothetical protein